jgi:RNA polymerase sigma factor (sigma-70 family)
MTTLEFSYSLHKMSKSLKPFALKLTRDMDDANDLMQDTIVKAFTNKDKFTDGTNLKAWLYTIMNNTFITNYQRMIRRGTFVDTTDNLHYLNSGDSLIENGAYGDFAMEDIQRAIAKLYEKEATQRLVKDVAGRRRLVSRDAGDHGPSANSRGGVTTGINQRSGRVSGGGAAMKRNHGVLATAVLSAIVVADAFSSGSRGTASPVALLSDRVSVTVAAGKAACAR